MNSKDTREDKWIAIKILLTVFLISGFFFKPSLTYSRFEFLTKALTHHGTTWIDKIQEMYGMHCIDSLQLGGHTYLEPTPGLSFVALASYLPYVTFLKLLFIRLFSLDPVFEFKISQFIMALSTVILFTALLIAIFFLSLVKNGYTQKKAMLFSFLLYFGSPVIFYSLNFSNGQDILQTSMLFTAFYVLGASKIQNRGLVFLSGLLCGLAVFVNGVSLFFLPLFIFIILLTKRWQNLTPWILGILFGLLPLIIYNQISFGNLLTSSYRAKYGTSLSLHLIGPLDIARILLISPNVGLFFYFPFVIMLILMFRKIRVSLTNRLILLAVLLYIVCLSIVFQSLKIAAGYGSMWYLNQGGGGPRYLLPIIPFLLYTIASNRWELEWEKIIVSVLMFVSVMINTPGLFWTGGQPIFFNNFLLFCKNGFHSYMIDLIKDILIKKGFNTGGLTIFPLVVILGIFIWWIWIGNKWVRRLL